MSEVNSSPEFSDGTTGADAFGNITNAFNDYMAEHDVMTVGEYRLHRQALREHVFGEFVDSVFAYEPVRVRLSYAGDVEIYDKKTGVRDSLSGTVIEGYLEDTRVIARPLDLDTETEALAYAPVGTDTNIVVEELWNNPDSRVVVEPGIRLRPFIMPEGFSEDSYIEMPIRVVGSLDYIEEEHPLLPDNDAFEFLMTTENFPDSRQDYEAYMDYHVERIAQMSQFMDCRVVLGMHGQTEYLLPTLLENLHSSVVDSEHSGALVDTKTHELRLVDFDWRWKPIDAEGNNHPHPALYGLFELVHQHDIDFYDTEMLYIAIGDIQFGTHYEVNSRLSDYDGKLFAPAQRLFTYHMGENLEQLPLPQRLDKSGRIVFSQQRMDILNDEEFEPAIRASVVLTLSELSVLPAFVETEDGDELELTIITPPVWADIEGVLEGYDTIIVRNETTGIDEVEPVCCLNVADNPYFAANGIVQLKVPLSYIDRSVIISGPICN